MTRTSLLLRAAGWGLGLSAGVVAGALVGAAQISKPRRPWPDYRFTPYEIGIPADDVAFTSADGTPLAGWWFDRPDSDTVIICCHGHHGSKSDMLGVGPGLWREGYGVFLFDFRGCGDSGDGPQSLAHYERDDLRAAIDEVARRRPGAKIGVMGFSMGAAASIMVAATDSRVFAVVADSSFADMTDVITTAARRLRLPPFPVVQVLDRTTGYRYGYRFGDVQPIELVARIAPRPLLLLHGEKDRIIPVKHSHRLLAAAGEHTSLRTYPEADHCGGYFGDRPAYVALVAGFFDAAREAADSERPGAAD